jgi:hypothetical protein
MQGSAQKERHIAKQSEKSDATIFDAAIREPSADLRVFYQDPYRCLIQVHPRREMIAFADSFDSSAKNRHAFQEKTSLQLIRRFFHSMHEPHSGRSRFSRDPACAMFVRKA